MNEFCSLIAELRSDKVITTTEWVNFISCHFKLQSRLDLFRLFIIYCETLCSACSPLFHLSSLFLAKTQMHKSFHLAFAVYKVLLPLFKRSKGYSYLLTHFLVLMISLVNGQDFCSSEKHRFGTCCLRLFSTGYGYGDWDTESCRDAL